VQSQQTLQNVTRSKDTNTIKRYNRRSSRKDERLEDHIKRNLYEKQCESVDWIHLAQKRVLKEETFPSVENKEFLNQMGEYQLKN
jgi:hypothetical protein